MLESAVADKRCTTRSRVAPLGRLRIEMIGRYSFDEDSSRIITTAASISRNVSRGASLPYFGPLSTTAIHAAWFSPR